MRCGELTTWPSCGTPLNQRLLSPDGKSYAFDSRANGYGRGEGSATVLLKRLDDALRDGDAIRAVIRETGVNQDGYTETITSPSPRAQQQLMEDCYRRAGLEPAQTTYIEAHGTGTPTGDPVEAKAIAATFRRQQTDGMPSQAQQPPLFLGSVKTNIGHTETASGLASVIRAALCLEKRQIPPHLNFEQANQELKLDDMSMKVGRRITCCAWKMTGPTYSFDRCLPSSYRGPTQGASDARR